MLGTLVNTAAIVAGGGLGRVTRRPLTPAQQQILKKLLGALTVYVGLSLTWQGLNGSIGRQFWQLGVVLAAMILGRLAGRVLRLQRTSNRLGQYAKATLAGAQPGAAHRFSDGFITCTLLFCVGPLAVLGALQDGFGNIRVLAVKSVMDGLATLAFAKTFGWSVIGSALPVLVYQGTIALLAGALMPFLQQHSLLDACNATGGLLVFCIALVILELKRIELADYLPSLAIAPLLAWWGGY